MKNVENDSEWVVVRAATLTVFVFSVTVTADVVTIFVAAAVADAITIAVAATTTTVIAAGTVNLLLADVIDATIAAAAAHDFGIVHAAVVTDHIDSQYRVTQSESPHFVLGSLRIPKGANFWTRKVRFIQNALGDDLKMMDSGQYCRNIRDIMTGSASYKAYRQKFARKF